MNTLKQQISLAVEHMLNNGLDYVPLQSWEDLQTNPNALYVTNFDNDTKQEGLFLFMGQRVIGTINL